MNKYRFFLLSFFIVIISCQEDKMAVNLDKFIKKEKEVLPVFIDYNVNVTLIQKEKIKVKIFSPTRKYFDADTPYFEFLDTVIYNFYDANQKESGVIYAQYSKIIPSIEYYIVQGKVNIISKKGDYIKSEEMIWDKKNKLIFTNKEVAIKKKDEIIYGKGFEASDDLENYRIKEIRGTIVLDDED